MAVLLLCSAAGAPGVTSTALGLALWWPREVVLVDADPHPCHAVEAGYLGGRGRAGGGLAELVRAHRQGADLTAALWAELVELPRPGSGGTGPGGGRTEGAGAGGGDGEGDSGGSGQGAHYLSGFGHPAQPALFEPVWAALAGSFAELGRAGIDVVVDLGRVPSAGAARGSAAGLPADLVARASALGIVSRTGLRSLAGLSLHREQIDAAGRLATASLGLVLVGSGQPYSASEIQSEFGLPVMAEVVADARAASVLSDGVGLVAGSIPRGWGRGRYVSSLRHAAGSLHRRMARHAGIALPGAGPIAQPEGGPIAQPEAGPIVQPEAGGIAHRRPVLVPEPPGHRGAGETP